MTREEAIAELNTFKISAKSELGENALDMAIKALKKESCDDCVSRQAVLETIDDCNKDGLKGIFCSYDDGERFKKYIKNLPSVTPARKKGKWIEDYIPLPLSDGSKKCYQCSECRTHWDNVFNCCPNCGAEMESEE